MPVESQRCPRHASAPVVGNCDGCGEPLCLACAVPVRGRVLGPVCLETELGDPPPSAIPPAPLPDPARRIADAGLLGVLLSTILPWSGVGLGAGPFGAWGTEDPRWASLVVIASLIACALLSIARLRGERLTRTADRTAATGALASTLAAALAILIPPPYTSPALGAWAAVAAGAVASAASVAVLRREGAFA